MDSERLYRRVWLCCAEPGAILAQGGYDVKQMSKCFYSSITVSARHIAVMMSVIPPTTPQRTWSASPK